MAPLSAVVDCMEWGPLTKACLKTRVLSLAATLVANAIYFQNFLSGQS